MIRLTAKAAIAALVLITSAAKAGPTADRLRDLGSNVATPEQRPSGKAVERTFDNPLDGGEDRILLTPPTPKLSVDTAPETAEPREPRLQETAAPVSAGSSCLAELQKIADAESVPSPQAKDKACTIEDPVRLTATRGPNAVSFSGKPVLACNVALRFAQFTADTIKPLAAYHVGSELTQVGTGPGFTCRRRNGAATGKLSEHAFGKGIDIISFSFEGKKRLDVRAAAQMSEPRAKFQNAVRKAACGHFTTVLGPGSNAAHATHLHFDTGREDSGKENPYRICQ